LTEMVAGGAGVTLLPALAVASEHRLGGLVMRRFAGVAPTRTLAIVRRPHTPLAETITAIAKVLRDDYERASRA
jgi:LysR family hydrogen peroxide-inducible transcriptional activator